MDALTSFYSKEQLSQVNDIINYDDVFSRQWNIEEDKDLKRRKEAELLIKDDLPVDLISGYVVYNDRAKQQLLGLGIEETKIAVRPSYYY